MSTLVSFTVLSTATAGVFESEKGQMWVYSHAPLLVATTSGSTFATFAAGSSVSADTAWLLTLTSSAPSFRLLSAAGDKGAAGVGAAGTKTWVGTGYSAGKGTVASERTTKRVVLAARGARACQHQKRETSRADALLTLPTVLDVRVHHLQAVHLGALEGADRERGLGVVARRDRRRGGRVDRHDLGLWIQPAQVADALPDALRGADQGGSASVLGPGRLISDAHVRGLRSRDGTAVSEGRRTGGLDVPARGYIRA